MRIGDQEVEEGEEPTYNITVRKDTFEIVLEGLDPYTRYQIKVSGFSRMGDGPSAISAGGMVSSPQLCSRVVEILSTEGAHEINVFICQRVREKSRGRQERTLDVSALLLGYY